MTPIAYNGRMMFTRRRLAWLAALVALLLAAPAHAQARSVYVGDLPLNLRAGPGLSFAVQAELAPGEALTVIGESGVWLNVQRAGGQTGWVHSEYVSSTLPASPPPAPGPTVVEVITGRLNLRSGPGLSYSVVAELPQGEKLNLLARSGAWLNLLRGNGQQGWANTFYMQLTDAPPSSAPAPSAATAATAATLTGSALCRPGDVLFGVQNPSRLKVLNSCLTVTGVVVESSRSQDGDLTFRLQVDPAYAWVLNSANRSLLRDYLQVEIIPADQLAVAAPAIGSRVSVTGAYVLDIPYGWNEIHPAWLVTSVQ